MGKVQVNGCGLLLSSRVNELMRDRMGGDRKD